MSCQLGKFIPKRVLWKKLPYLFVFVLFIVFICIEKRFKYPYDKRRSNNDEQIRDLIEIWHKNESSEKLPKLFLEKSYKWNRYDPKDLVFWEDPKQLASNPEEPGNLGQPVILSKEEKVKSKQTFSTHQLNLVASDKVPLNRVLPDFKNKK